MITHQEVSPAPNTLAIQLAELEEKIDTAIREATVSERATLPDVSIICSGYPFHSIERICDAYRSTGWYVKQIMLADTEWRIELS